MTVELGHHTLQRRHGVMSGKTQTGQKQLTKQKGKERRGTSSQGKKSKPNTGNRIRKGNKKRKNKIYINVWF